MIWRLTQHSFNELMLVIVYIFLHELHFDYKWKYDTLLATSLLTVTATGKGKSVERP